MKVRRPAAENVRRQFLTDTFRLTYPGGGKPEFERFNSLIGFPPRHELK